MRSASDTIRRGFTLLDLMITLAVMAIIATLVAPSISSNDGISLVSAATILASDLEYAQSESLTNPADPTFLVIDATEKRYWLALASDTQTPIARPEAGPTVGEPRPYEVVFGEGEVNYLSSVGVALVGGPSGNVPFDPYGRLSQPGNARIRLWNESGELFVIVSATTGTVSIE